MECGLRFYHPPPANAVCLASADHTSTKNPADRAVLYRVFCGGDLGLANGLLRTSVPGRLYMDRRTWKHVVRGGGLHVDCGGLPAGNDAHLPQKEVDNRASQEYQPSDFWIEREG